MNENRSLRDGDVQALLKVLDKLLVSYKQVLSACKMNKDGLVTNDTARMEQALEDINDHVAHVNVLEEQRQRVLRDMARSLNVPEEELTVTYLTEHLSATLGKRLSAVATELKTTFEDIAEVNRLNEELVGRSVDFFNRTLELISSALDSSNYGAPLKGKNRVTGRLFDAQA